MRVTPHGLGTDSLLSLFRSSAAAAAAMPPLETFDGRSFGGRYCGITKRMIAAD